MIEDDRVVGLLAERDGKQVAIQARQGVVLAAGGFSHSQQLREKYLPAPTLTEWTSAAEGQTGDVIEASLRAGATLDLMDKVWVHHRPSRRVRNLSFSLLTVVFPV